MPKPSDSTIQEVLPGRRGMDRAESSTPELPPYRILRRAGTGGMGEVFLAHDGRLDRHVAIKRLRPDQAQRVSVRARLRREARFAARLDHPAIVRIHDVLERDGEDFLVMEWVDGEDLRRVIERGPLPLGRAVDIAQQIAGALAEAHRRGVVHRDLKSENVLVTEDGRAKVTDFGIAKWLPGAEGDPGAAFKESLTADQALLGTCRSMAPEQALGKAVGPWSDLFSLGVLLYEMLTGESPFVGHGPLDTLRRVIEHDPSPVEGLRPDAQPALVALVTQLLSKEPALRPRNAGEVERLLADLTASEDTLIPDEETGQVPRLRSEPVRKPRSRVASGPLGAVLASAVALLVVGLVVGLVAFGPRFLGPIPGEANSTASALVERSQPLYVAAMAPSIVVEPPVGSTNLLASDAADFAEAVRVAMLRGLIALEGVSPKATSEIDRGAGDPVQVARSVAADEALTASILYRSGMARISIARLRVADGVVLTSSSVEVPVDSPLLAFRAVGAQVRGAYPTETLRPDLAALDVDPGDLRRFLEVSRRFSKREDPAGESLLDDLSAIQQTSPHFVDAPLLEAEIALYRFFDSRQDAHLERARDAVERARTLQAAGDPRVLRTKFLVEVYGGRHDEAQAALEQLAIQTPGDVDLLDLEAQLLRARGQGAEALSTWRRAVALRPTLARLVHLARVELDLGEIDSARDHLQQALALSADDFEALSQLAQLELTVGEPDTAIELYERLLAQSAGVSERSNLGLAHLLLGHYELAAEHFEHALAAEPRNPFFALNLADALSLAGDPDSAEELYRRVVERIEEDPASRGTQFLTVRAQALAHLGRNHEAVAAIQQAVGMAPESASVAYEAALVYALVGEPTSAGVHAEAALERGVEPRWFDFPWFDALRQPSGSLVQLTPPD